MTPQELFELALSYYSGTDNIPQDYLKAYGLFLEAAEEGHVGAQSYLGRMLSMGEGVEKNYDKAVKWLKLAAEAGDADAQNRLGVRYEYGQGVNQDYAEAARMFKLSAEQGNAKAQVNLAEFYKDGIGVEQDYNKAFNLLQIAAEQSAPLAYFYLGVFYLNGYGISIDYDQAYKWFLLAADDGNPDALHNIAYMYRNGLGREVDTEEAIIWYKRAAEKGDQDSLSIIGDIYKDGEGVPQDYCESFKWYKQAAEKGDSYSQGYIGYYFEEGLGVAADYLQAIEWYQKACDNGNEVAAFNIGVLYENGLGVIQDHTTALNYFRKSADMGYTPAMTQVGKKYQWGEGVEVDIEQAKYWLIKAFENGEIEAANDLGCLEKGDKAIEWFKKGAEKGHAYCQYNLGRIYQHGEGVEIDYQEAFKWYELAAANGFQAAYNNMGVMQAEGKGVPVDFKRAKEYYQRSIELDGHYSVSNIAHLWFEGNGIEKHVPEAIRLYNHGYAKYNHLYSLLHLTDIYLFGIGVSKDYRLAVSLMRKLNRAGIDVVCYNLGCAYYHGYGVAQNKQTARKYWHKVKDYDKDSKRALLEENDINFRFSTGYLKEGSPFHAEELYMFENREDNYIERCISLSNSGDTDALFNIYRALATRERRDFIKEKSYFDKALSAKHPQAMFLDRLYKNRSSISEIDFTTPFYIDEIIESQFGMPSDDEVLGIIFMIFSIIKGYNLKDLPSEAMSTSLYHTYVSLLSDDVQKSKLEEIHRLCTYKDVRNLTEELKEYLLDVLEGDSQGTTLYPSRQVVEMIFQHLKLTLKKSSYDLIGGAAKCAIIDPSITSNLYVKNQRNFALYSLLTDLLEGNNLFLFNQMKPANTNSIIAIAFPELRRHQHQDFDVTNEQVDILRFILEQKATYKQGVLLVDREFCSCVNTEMYEARKLLFENHCLHKVVELPKGTFGDLDCPSALLFLDFTTTAKEVKFVTGESKVVVSYACLENNDYCLNSNLYNQPAAEGENHAEYRLCDLVEINQSFEFIAGSAYVVEEADYSGSLLYVLQGRRLLHQRKNQINAYKGPHIFMRYDKGVKLFVHNDDSSISCDTHTYAIKVNTAIVDTSYMAYLLLDKTISEYLSEIVDGKGMFMPRDLLYRKISIPVDKAIQKQIVEEALVKERQMSGSGVEYNIILVAEDPEKLEKDLNEKGINIFHKLNSVNGEWTFDDLYEKYIEDPSRALVDAIIVDTNIDDYEDVLYYFRTIRERNIEIYLLGDKSKIRVGGNKLKEYFFKENRVFNISSKDYLERLLNKMRDDLDSSNAPQAKIRNKYKAVFEAADALDKKYPDIGISKTVLRYIQTGCNIDDIDNVSGPCGSFRNVCHKLLQVFISKKLVPDIDPGAIPAMLKDGKFYDGKNQRTYVLKEQFMSKYLSRALEYFCKVTNEGVHGSQDSSRLGTAALNILMEFIVWFYENDICSEKLDSIQTRPCYEDITDKIPALKGKVYTVKAQGAGKERYLYADNIHIKEDKRLKPGMKVKIKDVGAEMISDDVRRKIDDEYMVFYTSNYDIL